MRTQTLGLKLLVCLFVVFALVARGEAQRIKVSIPGVSTSIALAIGDAKGYYREEGIEVVRVHMSPPIANLAVIGQNTDFSLVPFAGISAALRGAPLRVLMTTFYRPLFWLYVKPDITSVEQLRGKKIGVGGIGTATGGMLIDLLKRNRMVAGRDLAVIGVGRNPDILVALLSGAIDGGVLVFPFNLPAERRGFRELVSFVKEDYVMLFGAPVVHENFHKSNPETVEKFLRGTLKGILYFHANRKGTIAVLAKDNNLTMKEAEKVYDLIKPAVSLDGTISKEMQQQNLDLILKVRKMKQSPPIEKFFDFSLAKKLNAELRDKGWKPGM